MDKGTPEEVKPELFTDQERNTIIRSFIDAYLRGSVKIDFPKRGETALTGGVWKGQEVVQLKTRFTNDIAMLVGTVKTTRTQFDEALKDFFETFVQLRNTNRIVGNFLSITDSERIRLLEDRIANLEQQFEELETLIRIRGNQPP